MKICSVTLAGPGTEAIIGDAIRSASWCDDNLVIDTFPGNEPFDAARSVNPRVKRSYRRWEDDFALMRNAALTHAQFNTQADWAIWLDTDERIICPDPAKLRQTLAEFPEVDTVSAPHISGEYHKDRMLRLPQRGKYVGPTHEYWKPDEDKPVLRVGADLLAFDELPRDPSDLQAKMERDASILSEYAEKHPHEARWKYFLGQTLDNMGYLTGAVDAWLWAVGTEDDTALEIRGWAAFRAAEKRLTNEPEMAIRYALRGLAVYPASPELLWLIATAHLHLEKPRQALHWAHLCLASGKVGGGPVWERSGFRWLPAHYEAPLEVSTLAYEAMGDERMATKAREMVERVKAMREAA